jgi:hypothetical protein
MTTKLNTSADFALAPLGLDVALDGTRWIVYMNVTGQLFISLKETPELAGKRGGCRVWRTEQAKSSLAACKQDRTARISVNVPCLDTG